MQRVPNTNVISMPTKPVQIEGLSPHDDLAPLRKRRMEKRWEQSPTAWPSREGAVVGTVAPKEAEAEVVEEAAAVSKRSRVLCR